MNLNEEELKLIHKALHELNTSNFGPTRLCELAELENKINKQLTKHDWKMLGKPGMFDDNYKCTRCGEVVSESADSSYTKPEFGCKS